MEYNDFRSGKNVVPFFMKYPCDLWCLTYDFPGLPYFMRSPEWKLIHYGSSVCLFVRKDFPLPDMGRLSEIGIASNLDISQATKILHFALKIKDLDTAHEIVNSMKIGFPFPQRKALILQAHVDLGTAFEERKMIREAIAEFQKAASINTDKQSALYCKLGKLFLDTGDPDRAIEQYLNALDKDHNSINILQNLAIIYSTKGKNDVALQYLRKIITIDPNNSNAYYNMSCIYAEQHKTEESIKWLKVAIEKGFDDWLLLKLDKDLESIRSSDYYKSLFKKDFHYSN